MAAEQTGELLVAERGALLAQGRDVEDRVVRLDLLVEGERPHHQRHRLFGKPLFRTHVAQLAVVERHLRPRTLRLVDGEALQVALLGQLQIAP
ncbi:hypothetical protein OHB49_01485 [Streptomyces sp. NBC_01717]|uniref:hypothetical protein n=1 Tax=Streptomyces sp. NBC_01717 TaxID=2975918 RepID=UPI002E344FC0|nr:hypothetical protein [Streptomyces sp. NBC_01717]